MLMADNFLFTLHQFIISFLSLFFIYYAWRDLRADTYEKLKTVSIKFIGPILIGIFIGVYMALVNEWGPVSIFLSFSFALLITLSIFDPKYAVSFFVFLLISRPWEYFKNELMMSMLRDIFILCFLSFIGHRIFRKKFYFKWNSASAFTLFYAIWTFLTIFPNGQSSSILSDYSEVFIKNIIVFFLIINVVDKKEFIAPIKAALFLGITEKMIISFHKIFILKEIDGVERMTGVGMIENANDIAAILILAIPFTISYFNNIKNSFLKYFLILSVYGFYFIIIWQAKSRGATLGLGAFLLMLYWLKVKNKRIATVMVVAGCLLSYVALSSIKRDSTDVENSTSNRLIFWKAGVNMAVRNPVFGVGYEGFINNLQRYANGVVGSEGSKKTIHSTWLLALAETGFIGFSLYMALWFIALKTAWAMKYNAPEYLLAIISYGTAITFLSHTYMLYPYILIGLTIAAGPFYQDEKAI